MEKSESVPICFFKHALLTQGEKDKYDRMVILIILVQRHITIVE